jgi:membrane-anchored glycerophosphoryl diester phosphodiesterase (GDPDase)
VINICANRCENKQICILPHSSFMCFARFLEYDQFRKEQKTSWSWLWNRRGFWVKQQLNFCICVPVGEDFEPATLLSPLSIIISMLYIYRHLTRRTSGWSLVTITLSSVFFWISGRTGAKAHIHLLFTLPRVIASASENKIWSSYNKCIHHKTSRPG